MVEILYKNCRTEDIRNKYSMNTCNVRLYNQPVKKILFYINTSKSTLNNE